MSAFPEAARPAIKNLNVVLRELCALEGTIRQPRRSRRSDATVARGNEFQVDVSRITPSITEVVSGSSTVVGTPSLTLDTVNAVGSTTTAVSINSTIAMFDTTAPSALGTTAATGSVGKAARRDHQHAYPDSLQSVANSSTLTLTDDGSSQDLTGSLGNLQITPGTGGTIFLGSGVASPSTVASVKFTAGSSVTATYALQTQYTTTGISSNTVGGWNINMAHSSQMIGSTIIGYNSSTFTATPGAGSDTTNSMYGAIINGPSINNNTGGFQEVAAIKMGGARRIASNPTVTAAYGAIIECPSISGNTQVGIHIRQRTAQATAAVRAGIVIDAQNSGTVRHSILGISDLAKFTGPLDVDGAFGVTGVATLAGRVACGNSVSIDGAIGITAAATVGGTASVAGYLTHTGPKLGLLGATPTVQYGTTGTATGFAAGTSTAVTCDSTFTGNTGSLAFTIGDVIFMLKQKGLLAY